MKINYWCPTCKKHLIVEVNSSIVCGSPVCAVCNGQVWKKSAEWAKGQMKMEIIKVEEQKKRDARDRRIQ